MGISNVGSARITDLREQLRPVMSPLLKGGASNHRSIVANYAPRRDGAFGEIDVDQLSG